MKLVQGITDKCLEEVIANIGSHYDNECKVLWDVKESDDLIRYSAHISIESFTFVSSHGCTVGIGGITELTEFPGYAIWFIGSDLMDDHPVIMKDAWKIGRKLVADMKRKYYRLSNFCINHPNHLRVLQDLGFKISDTNRPEVKFICAS